MIQAGVSMPRSQTIPLKGELLSAADEQQRLAYITAYGIAVHALSIDEIHDVRARLTGDGATRSIAGVRKAIECTLTERSVTLFRSVDYSSVRMV